MERELKYLYSFVHSFHDCFLVDVRQLLLLEGLDQSRAVLRERSLKGGICSSGKMEAMMEETKTTSSQLLAILGGHDVEYDFARLWNGQLEEFVNRLALEHCQSEVHGGRGDGMMRRTGRAEIFLVVAGDLLLVLLDGRDEVFLERMQQ
jgi:hypothetical protein